MNQDIPKPSVNSSIFKAYDIRGLYPSEINEDTVYKIAQAYAAFVKPKEVVLGKDVRLSGPSLWEAAKNGFIDAGVDVVDIGVISTDMLYFTIANYGYQGGMTISASHNPGEYNGVKMVRENAVPISSDTGIFEMRDWIMAGNKIEAEEKGKVSTRFILDDYAMKILSFFKIHLMKEYTIVANANFGMAGLALKRVIEIGELPLKLVELNFTLDGTFPKGPPNPLLPENGVEMTETVKKERADFGVAWDADADRCFFYDEHGVQIDGFLLTSIQAEYFLNRFPHCKILSDPRNVLAVEDTVKVYGGELILNKSGHSFIKERMKAEDVVFGGEMSGHYYYKDFYYCDNGMVPLVIMLQLMEGNINFSDIFKVLKSKYFVSGEINFTVKDSNRLLELIKEKYSDGTVDISDIDGLSFRYIDWRFNVRTSNTEPLVRLNVESKKKQLTEEKTKELSGFISSNSN